MITKISIVISIFCILLTSTLCAQETLPPLKDGKAPQTLEELWAGYDPKKEPLEIEVLKEWEEDGVILRVVRYRIGIFKGHKTIMAGIYGFPKGGSKLPALVQIHGGGQFADYKAPLTNAKRGYATFSVAWAGRISAPGYSVDSDIVNLFIEGNTADPKYKLTTDWKGFNGYHAVDRNKRPAQLMPEWKLDDVTDSPRNSSWFMWALGCRRAVTYLEQQPEVDPQRIGVYGHSMGGKLTVMLAAGDSRIKAGAPSCGGLSARTAAGKAPSPIDDNASLPNITCPIIFLSPANDFHGHINDLQKAIKEIKSPDWRLTCAAHHQHQDTAEYQVAGPLWFDQIFLKSFQYPKTPESALQLKTKSGIPSFTITPDPSKKILAVDIYYTQQGKEGEPHDMNNTSNRFWHHAKAIKNGSSWTAELPLFSTDKQLWVYGNVLYPLEKPVTAAGYYYGVYTATTFNLSSRMEIVFPEQLQAAGIKATAKRSLLIEDFAKDWQKEWYTYDLTDNWTRLTHKVYDPQWAPPPFAKLGIEVKSAQPNKLVISLDDSAAEITLKGGPEWQSIELYPTDFRNGAGTSFLDWKENKTLRLGYKETLKSNSGGTEKKIELGAEWQGPKPEFKNLRWIPGTKEELNARRTVKLSKATPENGKTYLDIQYADVFTHGHKAVMNTDLDGKPLVVDKTTYTHGIATHAPSEAIYFLGKKYIKFHVIAASGASASVTFQIIADDKKIFETASLTGSKFQVIDLPLNQVNELKLIITDGGNGKGGDAASWVDAWVE